MIMDSKVLIIFVLFSLLLLIASSCDPGYHEYFAICNKTKDTIVVCLNENIYKEWKGGFAPNQTSAFTELDNGSSLESELESLINDNYQSFRVYRHDTCLVHWEGKMQHLGDSIHNFYNYDSWTTVVTGKYTLCSTFTITEDDLRQPVE